MINQMLLKYIIVAFVSSILFNILPTNKNPIKDMWIFITFGILIFYLIDTGGLLECLYSTSISEKFTQNDISLNKQAVSSFQNSPVTQIETQITKMPIMTSLKPLNSPTNIVEPIEEKSKVVNISIPKNDILAIINPNIIQIIKQISPTLNEQKVEEISKQITDQVVNDINTVTPSLNSQIIQQIVKQIALFAGKEQGLIITPSVTPEISQQIAQNINQQLGQLQSINNNIKPLSKSDLLNKQSITQLQKIENHINGLKEEEKVKLTNKIINTEKDDCNCEKKIQDVLDKYLKKGKYIDDRGMVNSIIDGDMRYNQLDPSMLQPMGSYDKSFTNKWDHGFTYLSTDRWAPPKVKVHTAKTCDISPNNTTGYPIGLMEFDNSRKILGPDNINVDYIQDKLNSK